MPIDIAPHFPVSEFERQGKVPPELRANLDRLRGVLQRIRMRWAGPLKIVSGYRPEDYNRKLYEASAARNGGVSGVAKNSAHITAEAADIRPIPLDQHDSVHLHKLILAMYNAGKLPELGGLGLYPTWVHVDVRQVNNRLRRWIGDGFGSEQGAAKP